MTRIPYDQAAKRLIDGALEDAGRVEMQREVTSDPQWIDIWFEPSSEGRAPPGTLGRIARKPCALELFHAPPSRAQILRCLAKLIAAHQQREPADAGAPLPGLWIISAGRPTTALDAFAMTPCDGWPAGVHRIDVPALPLHIVVVSELPRVRETLLLRLMGARSVLRDALDDLARLPPDAWERRAATGAVRVLHSFAAEAGLLARRTWRPQRRAREPTRRSDMPHRRRVVRQGGNAYLRVVRARR